MLSQLSLIKVEIKVYTQDEIEGTYIDKILLGKILMKAMGVVLFWKMGKENVYLRHLPINTAKIVLNFH